MKKKISPIALITALLSVGITAWPTTEQNRIAELLGWHEEDNTHTLCRGAYRNPEYITAYPIIDEHAPVKITAEGPEFLRLNGVSELKDNVVIAQPGRMIRADHVFIFRDNHTGTVTKIILSGNVRIYQGGSALLSDNTTLVLYPHSVTFEKTVYRYYSKFFNAWGTAKKGHQNPANVTTLEHATYSTCSPSSPSWQIFAKKIVLDKPHNIGKAYSTILKLHDFPVFYSPYYSFQLNNARKTGILVPLYGHTSDAGSYFGLPFYINWAPNYDAFLTPEYYGDRGFKMDAAFHYLSTSSKGSINASILPNDLLFETFRNNALTTYSNTALYPSSTYEPYLNTLEQENNVRGMLNAENYSVFNRNLSARYYINLVSDSYYLTDITAGSAINNPLANQLLNLMQLNYANSTWDLSAYLEEYQTLHLITQIQDQGQTLDQYSSLPALDAHGYFMVSPHMDTEFNGDFNSFSYYSTIDSDKPTGERIHMRPGITFTLENSGAYVKPQVWLDSVAYSLDNTSEGTSTPSSRTLPIVNFDAGLHFLHPFEFNNESYQQTIEPRLFYLYVPYANQDYLPNFDTIELPFFFDQLFALNTFQGVDRLENANQLSVGITSDMNSINKGRKLFRFDLGSIYYFTQPNVCLTSDCTPVSRNFSPIITDFSFYPTKAFSLSSSYAFDPETSSTNNAAFTLSYHGDGDHIVYLSYVYVESNDGTLPTFSSDTSTGNTADNFANSSSHLIGSAAWPITDKWNILGHSDYNLALDRLDSVYGGLEYDTCCWAIRFIVKELFDSSTVDTNGSLQNTYNTSYFIQINLKGLASFGSGANPMVRNIIPGYKS